MLRRWPVLLAATLITAGLPAVAQQPTPPTVAQIIAQNTATPNQLCPRLITLIRATPSLASDVVAAVSLNPALAEPLCGCLSRVQTTLANSNPQGAQLVAAIMLGAPPACQAAYAVAQASSAGTTVVAASGDGGGGGGSGFGFGTGGSTPGGGGGVVSPSRP